MDKPQRKLGQKVMPRRTAMIKAEAQEFRDFCQYPVNGHMGKLLMALQACEILDFEVVDAETPTLIDDLPLGDEEARAFPDEDFISIRSDVYDKLFEGCGHSRFTIAHEFGHLVMHKNVVPSFARGEHQIFEDSEWQADVFASEFLIDSDLVDLKTDTPVTISERCGVSEFAAEVKLNKLKEKLEKEKQ